MWGWPRIDTGREPRLAGAMSLSRALAAVVAAVLIAPAAASALPDDLAFRALRGPGGRLHADDPGEHDRQPVRPRGEPERRGCLRDGGVLERGRPPEGRRRRAQLRRLRGRVERVHIGAGRRDRDAQRRGHRSRRRAALRGRATARTQCSSSTATPLLESSPTPPASDRRRAVRRPRRPTRSPPPARSSRRTTASTSSAATSSTTCAATRTDRSTFGGCAGSRSGCTAVSPAGAVAGITGLALDPDLSHCT